MIIAHIPTFIAAIALAIGIYRIKRFKSFEYLILLIISLNLIADLITWEPSMQQKNTAIYYNILVPTELILLLSVYYSYLPFNNIKRVLIYVIPALGIFSIINGFFIQDIFSVFASHTFIAGGFIVAVFSYILIRHATKEDTISKYNTLLWYAAANFVYYSISVPVLSSNNWLLLYSRNMAFPIYVVNIIVYGIWGLLISLGFIWKLKPII
jgi:hypothetical protein